MARKNIDIYVLLVIAKGQPRQYTTYDMASKRGKNN